MNKVVITIDGPAASGKGSLSKKISEEFNFFYMETGIYYRGFASLFCKNQINKNEKLNFVPLSRSFQKKVNFLQLAVAAKKIVLTEGN